MTFHNPPVPLLIAGGLWSILSAPARADVTLIARQSVTTQTASSPAPTPPLIQKVMLFYRGADTRLEVTGEPILVYDGKGNILYGLDPARKLYYMMVPTGIVSEDTVPSRGGQIKQDLKLDLHPTDQTLILAGVTAHQYTVTGTVTFTRSRPESGRQGGRHRRGNGGGGFPGGGFPMLIGSATMDQENGNGYGRDGDRWDGDGRGSPLVLPHWNINGDLWLADTLKFPAKQNTLFAAQLAAAGAGPFQQPLADALDKHKGLPLLARITVTHTPASSGGKAVNQFGGVEEGAGDPTSTVPTTTVTNWTVQSVSEAPLDEKVFRAAADYLLVAAPLAPYDPGDPLPAASK